MKAQKPYSKNVIIAFFVAAVIALIINYLGSLMLYDELSLNWPIILIVGVLAGMYTYLISLRTRINALEEQIATLEHQLKTKK